MQQLNDICAHVNKLTANVGDFILNERRIFSQASVEKKGPNDLVSYVDRKAEEMIVKGLMKILPEAEIIAEESTLGNGKEKNSEALWIIDPLDGTTNYIHGMPCFCISIGLMSKGELILGVVHELNFDECFYAWKGGGAYMDGVRINVSQTKDLSESLLATGFPYTDFSRMKEYMEIFDYCMRNTHGLRRLGSAAADLAYVACGRFEGFYEYGLNAWDVAAGALIVKEAGGTVTDFFGKDNYVFGEEIIAANGYVGDQLLKVVREKFGNADK